MPTLTWIPIQSPRTHDNAIADMTCLHGETVIGRVIHALDEATDRGYRWSWSMEAVSPGHPTSREDGIEPTRLQAKKQVAAAYRRAMSRSRRL